MRVFVLFVLILSYVGYVQLVEDSARASSSTSRPSQTTSKTGSSTQRSSARPTGTTSSYVRCYQCGGAYPACPKPFTSSPWVVAPNGGFCEKISPYGNEYGLISRGVSPLGRCTQHGCSPQYINGQRMEVCCCKRDLCNTGVISIKSTWTLLFSTLVLYVLVKQS